MRSKRLRKFRKQFPVAFFLVKLVLIWYLIVFSINYLTSGTAAHFYDMKETDAKILAGWSSLAFNSNGDISCEPTEIAVEVENIGEEDMAADGTYEVYYDENGDMEKLGLPVGEGEIPALQSKEKTKLTHMAQKPGAYAFLAEQPEGHPDDEAIWSEWVKVNCSSSVNETEQRKDQDEKEQVEESNDHEGAEKDNEQKQEKDSEQQSENKESDIEEDAVKEDDKTIEDLEEKEEGAMEETKEEETEETMEDTEEIETEEEGEAA